jgi:hypothetical protein
LRLNADFLQDAAAVEQAGICCPNLHYAKFGKLPERYHWQGAQADEEEDNQDDEEAEAWLAEGLSAMADRWKNLRMLRLTNPLQTVPGWPFWDALGQFSQLHDLRVQIELPEAVAEQPEEHDVVLLEGCKELRHLFIGVRADEPWEDDAFRSWRLHMESTVRAAMLLCLLRSMLPRLAGQICFEAAECTASPLKSLSALLHGMRSGVRSFSTAAWHAIRSSQTCFTKLASARVGLHASHLTPAMCFRALCACRQPQERAPTCGAA